MSVTWNRPIAIITTPKVQNANLFSLVLDETIRSWLPLTGTHSVKQIFKVFNLPITLYNFEQIIPRKTIQLKNNATITLLAIAITAGDEYDYMRYLADPLTCL